MYPMQEISSNFVVGSRLVLRALREEDLALIFNWMNRLPNRRFGRTSHPLSMEQIKKIVIKNQPSHDVWFGVWHLKDETMIGTVCFGQIDHLNRNAIVGLEIGDDRYWRQGLGTEAVTLITKYGFEDLNLHRIEAQIFEGNEGSIKCFEKNGYTLESIQKEKLYLEGNFIGIHIFTKFDNDYFQKNEKI